MGFLLGLGGAASGMAAEESGGGQGIGGITDEGRGEAGRREERYMYSRALGRRAKEDGGVAQLPFCGRLNLVPRPPATLNLLSADGVLITLTAPVSAHIRPEPIMSAGV